jgi:hypothetical protein
MGTMERKVRIYMTPFTWTELGGNGNCYARCVRSSWRNAHHTRARHRDELPVNHFIAQHLVRDLVLILKEYGRRKACQQVCNTMYKKHPLPMYSSLLQIALAFF